MPIQVRVRYFAGFRQLMGLREETYEIEEGARLITLLSKIIPGRHGDVSKPWMECLFPSARGEVEREGSLQINGAYIILVNGRHYNEYPKGLDRILRDRDSISILEMMEGG